MPIEDRDPTPEDPHGGREEKKLLVLGWLLEFHRSSFELLATRVAQARTRARNVPPTT